MIGLSGCLNSPSTRLGYLAVSNWDDASGHRFDVTVERDGSVVHESSHRLDPKEDDAVHGTSVGCTWENVAGQYVVSVSVDDGSRTETNVGEQFDSPPECVVARVMYNPDFFDIYTRGQCDEVIPSLDGGCSAYKSRE